MDKAKRLDTFISNRHLVDPKGIEPSNLTDANRALSQLSYGPMSCVKPRCGAGAAALPERGAGAGLAAL